VCVCSFAQSLRKKRLETPPKLIAIAFKAGLSYLRSCRVQLEKKEKREKNDPG